MLTARAETDSLPHSAETCPHCEGTGIDPELSYQVWEGEISNHYIYRPTACAQCKGRRQCQKELLTIALPNASLA